MTFTFSTFIRNQFSISNQSTKSIASFTICIYESIVKFQNVRAKIQFHISHSQFYEYPYTLKIVVNQMSEHVHSQFRFI